MPGWHQTRPLHIKVIVVSVLPPTLEYTLHEGKGILPGAQQRLLNTVQITE